MCDRSGITIIYGRNQVPAERAYPVREIMAKYVRDNGIRLDRTPIYFVEISDVDNPNPKQDYRRLLRKSKLGPCFVSALNSTACLYLQNLFFNSHPETMHLNSSSTAVGLSLADNLLRIQIPDREIQRVYVWNIQQFQSQNVVLVKQPGIYYEGLAQSIADGLTAVGIPSLQIFTFDWNLETVNAYVGDPFTIVIIADDTLTYVSSLQSDPTINQKSFQILVSDSGLLEPTSDPEILTYLNSHSAQLFQTFIDAERVAITAEYEAVINNPDHPVTINTILMFVCFDLAVLAVGTVNRNRRTVYLNTYLDSNLDNTNAIYGGYRYVPNAFINSKFYFLYESQLYIGEEVESEPNFVTIADSSKIAASSSCAKICSPSKCDSFCSNVGIAVVYSENGFAAERSFEIRQILNKYIQDQGIMMYRYRLTFVELTATQDPIEDQRRLLQASRKHKVFLSALGTGVCQYLNTIFFSAHLDCIHLNTFSNVESLSSIPNLARYQSTTLQSISTYLYTIQQFVGNSQANCVIVYEDGIYSPELSSEIAAATTAATIPTIRIHRSQFTVEWLNANTEPIFSLVLVLGAIMDIVAELAADAEINLKNFQIVSSDSASLSVPTTIELTEYLQSKNARLIQQYITPRQLAIYQEYEAAINNPEHPVSTSVSYILAAFDWALLVTNTQPKHQLTRINYANLQLTIPPTLNNAVVILGTFSYILNGLAIDTFFYVYQDVTYRGVPT